MHKPGGRGVSARRQISFWVSIHFFSSFNALLLDMLVTPHIHRNTAQVPISPKCMPIQLRAHLVNKTRITPRMQLANALQKETTQLFMNTSATIQLVILRILPTVTLILWDMFLVVAAFLLQDFLLKCLDNAILLIVLRENQWST